MFWVVVCCIYLWGSSLPLYGQDCDLQGWPPNDNYDCANDANGGCVLYDTHPIYNCAKAYTNGDWNGINEHCACDGNGTMLPDLIVSAWGAANSFGPNNVLRLSPVFDQNKFQLKVTTSIANIGLGPFDIAPATFDPNNPPASNETIELEQFIWEKNSSSQSIERIATSAGLMINHPEHGHLHVENLLDMRLLDLNYNPIGESTKVSLCLGSGSGNCICQEPYMCTDLHNGGQQIFDTNYWSDPNNVAALNAMGVFKNAPEDFPNYGLGASWPLISTEYPWLCGATEQAILPGFMDVYDSETRGNYINIPCDLPTGEYLIYLEVNPNETFQESNTDNNIAILRWQFTNPFTGDSNFEIQEQNVIVTPNPEGEFNHPIWTFDNSVAGTLTVPSGIHLELHDMTLEFMTETSRIVVESGATLTISGSTLRNANCIPYWQGIEVQDGGTLEMESHHGNLPTIENAQIAIDAPANSVTAQNARFLNNEIGIRFRTFTTNNTVDIESCTFEVDSATPFSSSLFIEINGTSNDIMGDIITINNCTFMNTNTSSINGKTGIQAFNSTFFVTNSSFTNLDIAIQTGTTGTTGSSAPQIGRIGQVNSGNTFTACNYGINSLGDNEINIYDNTFSFIVTTAIHLLNTPLYAIEENTVNNCVEGIIVEGTGNVKKTGINRNTINGAFGAITALDNNEGLKLYCNDLSSSYDVTIEPTVSGEASSINSSQGDQTSPNDETAPASNKFTTSSDTHFFIDPNAGDIIYVHHDPSVEERYLPDAINDSGGNLELIQAEDLYCNTDCFPSDATDFDYVDGCPGVIGECGVCNGGSRLYGDCACGVSPQDWWPDNDGDGLGNPNYPNPYTGCNPPNGWVTNNDDPYDNCAGTFDECNYCSTGSNPPNCPGCTYKKTWYVDNDGDGLGDPDVSIKACDKPNGYVSNSCDSDDSAGICETYCNARNARWANKSYECPLYAAPQCWKCNIIAVFPYQADWNNGLESDLITSINSAPLSPKTWQKLMDASPYLADEILIAAVEQLKMPVGKLQQLLVLHTPLSEEVWITIKKRSQPLPQGIIRAIEQASKGKNRSERQKLGLKIAALEYNAGLWLNAAVKLHLLEGNIDTAIKLLAEDKKPSSQRRQVELLLQKGDYKQASRLLEQLPDDEDNNYYQRLQQINIDLQANKGSYESLTKYQLRTLRQIAQSHSTSSGYARSILRIATGEQFPLSMPKRKRRIVRKEATTFNNQLVSTLTIVPNPAHSMATISWNNTMAVMPQQLALYDLMGRLIQKHQINAKQYSLSIDLDKLSNGVYIVALQTDEQTIEQRKLVLIK